MCGAMILSARSRTMGGRCECQSCLRTRMNIYSYECIFFMCLRPLLDEYTRKCLALRVERRFSRWEVIEVLAEVMLEQGVPEHIRSDNGPEFVAKELRKWLAGVGAKTLYIEPGSPWENGYCESFNGKLRDECWNGEIFYSRKEAQVVIEKWRVQSNADFWDCDQSS